MKNLNGGKLRLPRRQERFINLTEYTPTPDEVELLQLGLNCHYADRPKPIIKRLEVEVLIDSLTSLERQGKLELRDPLKPLLLAEALTDRAPTHHHSLMSRDLRAAAKHLKQQEGITVRRADKTPALVLIDTDTYRDKLDTILSDETKFRRVRKNPVDAIKREANLVIERVNALSGAVKLPIIKGDYEPGYIYGNVKTHKNGNPLRPIISQIPTPTYHLAKKLNGLLTPYIPSKYRVQSSTDFLDIVRKTTPRGIIASLDVESLFTNVPVQQTINMICDRVYRDNTTPALGIPEDALRDLLRICTMESPFNTHRGQIYQQIDGVAMGSPLGVLFADFYMGVIEERVFSQHPTPYTYCRYVDDTFVQAEDIEEIEALRRKFEECSVLKFTMEESNNGTLPFLDVLLTTPTISDANNTSGNNNSNNNSSSNNNNSSSNNNNNSNTTHNRRNSANNNTSSNTSNQDNTTNQDNTINTNQRVLRSHTRRQQAPNNDSSNNNNSSDLNDAHLLIRPTLPPNTNTGATTGNGSYTTQVYRKPTNMGLCLNGVSECPDRYKRTAISAYIKRALTHCSSWKAATDEIDHSTQVLVNNGYSNCEIQKTTRKAIDSWYTSNNNSTDDDPPTIKLFYKNQYHKNYRKDEKALRDIITNNIHVIDQETKLKLIIYYSNKRTCNLIMKNNPLDTRSSLKRRNVVYQFTCPIPRCPGEYIGMTTLALSKRISCHAQEGNVYNHFVNNHNMTPDRNTIVNSFKIIDCNSDLRRLRFLEALHIAEKKPNINITQEPFMLPSLSVRQQ